MIESDALTLLVGAANFDQLVEVVLACNFASLNADDALNLLALVDYIGAELRTAHHHTLQALWHAQLPEQDHDPESARAPAESGDRPRAGTWGARRESAGGLCPTMVAEFGIFPELC